MQPGPAPRLLLKRTGDIETWLFVEAARPKPGQNPRKLASSTSKTRSKHDLLLKQHEQNLQFHPIRRTSKLGFSSENLDTGPGIPNLEPRTSTRRPRSIDRDRPAWIRARRTPDVEPPAGNSEPRMSPPGGRRADIKTWEFTRKTPLGSLPISGQNPRKSAKNAATFDRARGPWVRGQGPCFSQIFM